MAGSLRKYTQTDGDKEGVSLKHEATVSHIDNGPATAAPPVPGK